MPKNNITKILPFTRNQLFDLVMDIENYPQFLPWCSAARIKEKTNNIIIAELVISYKAFREKYTSKVELINEQGFSEIKVSLVEGPFSKLYNNWHFSDNIYGTEVNFSIDFTFKMIFFDKIIGSIFEKAFSKMYEAFYERACELYEPIKIN